MRYRVSLRLGDLITAKRIRRARRGEPREACDFACSLGLHMLWAHKPGLGLPLYRWRAQAINFPKLLPDGLTHVPLPDNPADDCETMVLEQGVGDVLYHLGHLKAVAPDATYRFVGEARYAALIARAFPNARFQTLAAARAEISGSRVHLSGDVLSRALERLGRFGPLAPLWHAGPAQGQDPRIGICWRGGSGQNRREERHIPLAFFLDMLPRDQRYVCLQHDVTDAERGLLQRDGRIDMPLVNLTGSVSTVLSLVARLRGVVSVDSANLHFAGLAGTPVLALTGRRTHWYWRETAQVEAIYPKATTLARADLGWGDIAVWRDGLPEPRRPDMAVPFLKGNVPARERPILVAGLPRSGTSMLMRVLQEQGLWVGETVGRTPENPFGFFENRRIRDVYVKGILRGAEADPAGVTSLPPLEALPPYPALRAQLYRVLKAQGHTEEAVWGFKDPKLTLVWPVFAAAFPAATWVIVTRPLDEVVDSLCRTSFMSRHSVDSDYWRSFAACYQGRLDRLKSAHPKCHLIDAAALRGGDDTAVARLCADAGLAFDPARISTAIAPDMMRRSHG
jgi:hypothetical protein